MLQKRLERDVVFVVVCRFVDVHEKNGQETREEGFRFLRRRRRRAAGRRRRVVVVRENREQKAFEKVAKVDGNCRFCRRQFFLLNRRCRCFGLNRRCRNVV